MGAPDDRWIVGNYGIVLDGDGTSWSTFETSSPRALRDVWRGQDSLWVVIDLAGLMRLPRAQGAWASGLYSTQRPARFSQRPSTQNPQGQSVCAPQSMGAQPWLSALALGESHCIQGRQL